MGFHLFPKHPHSSQTSANNKLHGVKLEILNAMFLFAVLMIIKSAVFLSAREKNACTCMLLAHPALYEKVLRHNKVFLSTQVGDDPCIYFEMNICESRTANAP